jgi:hypothetical protein
MADTDWSGLLGTVVVGGVAVKMTQSLFGNGGDNNNKQSKKKSKTRVGYPSTQYRPW